MAAILYPVFTLIHWLLFRWERRLRHEPTAPPVRTTLLLAVLMTLVYDALVISVGRLLGEGLLLEALNLPRFMYRALFTPLIMMVTFEYVRRVGAPWAESGRARGAAWAVTLVLISWGALGHWNLDLNPDTYAGALRYIPAQGVGPSIPVTLTILTAIGFGASLWRASGWPWLALGALIALAGTAAPLEEAGPLLRSGTEVLFAWALVATEKHIQNTGYTIPDSEVESRIGSIFSQKDAGNQKSPS